MTQLTVYEEQCADFTILSNRFIDEFMVSANEAQIKIYLYLLRMTRAKLSFGISDIADHFNYMEKDIMRALSYWEKQNLLSLDFDSAHNLKAVHVLPFPSASCQSFEGSSHAEIVTFSPKLAVNNPAIAEPATIYEKPVYSSDELQAFQNNDETAQIIFVAEQYTGRPLSASDLKSLLYIYDSLKFSADLIDYLIQYCVGKGKKQFSYIEKVAINWADSDILTVEQAKKQTSKYDKSVYAVMKALGKNSDPTDPELSFIFKWKKDMGFSQSIILKACERTVLATDKHRFEYANAILTKWQEAHVRTARDIEQLEEKRTIGSVQRKKSGSFNNIKQNDYDFDALEQILRSN